MTTFNMEGNQLQPIEKSVTWTSMEDSGFLVGGQNSPSLHPSIDPTAHPSIPPATSTPFPTSDPSLKPSKDPTFLPTHNPSLKPSLRPSVSPSPPPTKHPSQTPSSQTPSLDPSKTPSDLPTIAPSNLPTSKPSNRPTFIIPDGSPTPEPTTTPTFSPSVEPSSSPTESPTKNPSPSPTSRPTSSPTSHPTTQPSSTPSFSPSPLPTPSPTPSPTSRPTTSPSSKPTSRPTPSPTTPTPTKRPSRDPTTDRPTRMPTPDPTEIFAQTAQTASSNDDLVWVIVMLVFIILCCCFGLPCLLYLFRVARKVNQTNQQLKFLNRTNSAYLVDSDDDTYYDVSGGDNSHSRRQLPGITVQGNVGDAPRISTTLPGDFQIGDHVMVYDQLANTWLEGHVMNRMNDMYNVRVGLDSKIYLREELFNPSKMFSANKRPPNKNQLQGETTLNDSSDVLDSIEMLMDGLKSVTNELVIAGKRLPGATRQGGGDGFPDIPYRRKRSLRGCDSEDTMSSLPDNSGGVSQI